MSSESSNTYLVLLLLIRLPLIIITILGNMLVVLAWVTDSRVRTPSNAYLASLALVDLLTGLICMPMAFKYNYDGRWLMGHGACHFWLACVYYLVFVSSWHLALVALDRHRITFSDPGMGQNRKYTGVLQCIIATWLIGIYVLCPILFDLDNLSVDPEVKVHCLIKPTFLGTFYWSSLGIIFPALLMVVLYGRIYFKLRRRWRKLAQLQNSAREPTQQPVQVMHGVEILKFKTSKSSGSFDNAALHRKEWSAATTLGILIGIFLVCWLPYIIGTFLLANNVQVPRVIHSGFAILGWVNSAVNPIVYAVRSPKFRVAVKRMLIIFQRP